ncbi:MAG TPA: helix-turn-helix domain-containing protein [Gemmatimonadales bacterium]|jgi:PAS domain-containing protein
MNTPPADLPQATARAVLNALPQSVFFFGPDGRCHFANRSARTLSKRLDVRLPITAEAMPQLSAQGGKLVGVWDGDAKIGELVVVDGGAEPESTLADRERNAIVETLQQTGWRLSESAQRLGISRTTLWRRLKAYGLDRDGRGRWSRSY